MTDIVRIAHFFNTCKPDINGVARSVGIFREALIRMGHLVLVFAEEAPHEYKEPEQFIFRYPGVNVPKSNYSLFQPHSLSTNYYPR